jgi:hypothetical protein
LSSDFKAFYKRELAENKIISKIIKANVPDVLPQILGDNFYTLAKSEIITFITENIDNKVHNEYYNNFNS